MPEGDTPLTLKREGDKCLGETFIDRYTAWAATRTDAPRQYHTLNGVVILSAIMAPSAVLPIEYGEIRPNIWTMILAGTTITRKSTTMDMALRVLDDVHPDYLMATDGSPEGLLSELAFRDGKVSLFHRDEITGFIDSAANKEYLAGLLESMTRLYDGRREKRILRRESIEIKEPRFIILSGGIKTRMQEITSLDHIRSGFIPRFLMVSGSTSVAQMREIGPAQSESDEYDPREDVLKELFGIVNFWMPSPTQETVTVGGMKKKVEKKTGGHKMSATPDAWNRIREMQRDAITLGQSSHSPEIFMPMYQRLSDSVIKVSMLLAGSEQRTTILFEDVCSAISYADPWLATATEFAAAVEDQPDYNPWEKKAEKVIRYIEAKHPEPVTRSELMRKFHVRQVHIDDLERTLVSRGQITIKKIMGTGRGKGGSTSKERTEYHSAGGASGLKSDTFRNPDQGT